MGVAWTGLTVLTAWMLAVTLGASGCRQAPPAAPGGHETGRGLTSLSLDEATLLVEGNRVERAPEAGSQRFQAGWFPWRFEERVALGVSREGARLQLVQLEPRARTLFLDLVEAPSSPAAGQGVAVRVAGRELGVVPLTDPLEILLPEDLAPPLADGRMLVELTPVGDPPPPVDVLAAAVRPVLPPGQVIQDGEELVQSGTSRLEWVRRPASLEANPVLSGEVELPSSPLHNQSFSVTLRDEAGEVLGERTWAVAAGDDFGQRHRFRLPLAGSSAVHETTNETANETLVRVTLEARGSGPPARWRDLQWGAEAPATSPSAADPSPSASPAPPKELPRPRAVLVYVMDALRADFVGHLGGPEDLSPTWDRLAREGFTFRAHRSVAPSTLPSTQALLSGTALRFQEEWRQVGRGPLLAERFRRAGYRTGLFSGNGYVSPAYGLDQGFEHVAEEVLYGPDSPGEAPAGVNVNAARVQRAALEWLDTLEPDEPAFLYLHTIHPHNPYAPPPELGRKVVRRHFPAGAASIMDGRTDTLLAIENGEVVVSPADRERLRGLYAAAFAYNDQQVTGLLDALRERYGDGEVLLVLTSDHGEELFEHGGVLHGWTLYEEQLRIPLTLWWPGVIPPGDLAADTSTLDLHATLVELADPPSPDAASSGLSLWPWILGEASEQLPPRLHFAAARVRGGVFSVQGPPSQGVFAKRVQAARSETGWGMGKGIGRSRDPGYFFDLATDPGEQHNRLGRGGLAELWLGARLDAWIREGEERRAAALAGSGPADDAPLDEETRRRLESLGYLQ